MSGMPVLYIDYVFEGVACKHEVDTVFLELFYFYLFFSRFHLCSYALIQVHLSL